jgi:hypothetical protein
MSGRTEGGVKGGAFRVFPSLWRAGAFHPCHAPFPVWPFQRTGKRGALSVPLYFILRRVHRAPPVLSPRMGGPGSSRRSRLARKGASGRVRRTLPARPSPRPGPVVGRFPPSHATVARPTRTPSPSPTPRSGAGFPQGRCRHYAGAARGRGQKRKLGRQSKKERIIRGLEEYHENVITNSMPAWARLALHGGNDAAALPDADPGR